MGTRTQTLTLSGSTDGSTFDTLVPATDYVFDLARGNSVTITLSGSPHRFLRLTCTGNTGWPAGQIARFEAYS
ncbi:hypothetical protein AB0L41_34770 [Amycolatopsis mediterranei]|uniref:hypothetical protein n=1 Tax=Amycolatopsis mediterranei TaxID=33910 RepID=UPI00341E1995